jgi:hypothetical protein
MLKTIIAFLLLAAAAHPWWDEGHRIIAAIAEKNLDSLAAARVKALLPEGETLVSLASRADEIKQHRGETKAWHYIDLPVRETVTLQNLSSFCSKDGADLLSQLKKEIAALKDTALGLETRRENLMFLIHFMGDLHMPLHCADDNDKGGNRKEVRFIRPGGKRGEKTNLHALWDQMVGWEDVGTKINPGMKAQWRKGSVEDWALETYTLAKKVVYRNLPPGPSRDIIVLPEDYARAMRPYVEQQIQKAGLRLAAVLSDILI